MVNLQPLQSALKFVYHIDGKKSALISISDSISILAYEDVDTISVISTSLSVCMTYGTNIKNW
jgi:hypothetical protein